MALEAFPKREYGPADMPPMYEAKAYSFELSEEWLSLMAKEFDLVKAATEFAAKVAGKSAAEVEKLGQEYFEGFGRRLMKRALEVGEEYADRTYEVLKAACDKTGGYLSWPLLPQRFIEAVYLSTQDILVLPMVQNNHNTLQFQVEECKLYGALKEKCGQGVADTLPCRHACLAMVEKAFGAFELGASTVMTARTPKDEHCEFTTTRT